MIAFFQRFTNIAGVIVLAVGLAFLSILLTLGSFTLRNLTLAFVWRGLVWGGVFLAWSGFFTFYFSQFVLPEEGVRGLREGWSLLQLYFQYGNLARFRVDNPDLPNSFRVLGAGMLASHRVIAVGRGRSFGYAAGPGFVSLSPEGDEHIMAQTFDLRPQQEIFTSSAEIPASEDDLAGLHDIYEDGLEGINLITKDGIPLEMAVAINFQIKRPQYDPEQEEEDEALFPYEEDAIFRLCFAHSVDPTKSTLQLKEFEFEPLIIPWHRRIAPQIMSGLFTEISLYSLEELYESNGVPTLDKIRRDVQNSFREAFREVFGYHNLDDCPIEAVEINLRQLQTPSLINEQRIRDWETKWEGRIRQEAAGTEVEILQKTQNEKRSGQMEVIRSLIDSIGRMRDQSNPENKRVTSVARLQIVETLEELLEMELQGEQIPEPMLTTLGSMLSWLQVPPPSIGPDSGGFNP